MDFLESRESQIAANRHDQELLATSKNFFIRSVAANYSYNFDWLGFPIIQYPQDILALQEIIHQVRPTLIVETGFARGGSSVFFASMLDLVHANTDVDWRVATVDISFNKESLKKVKESRYGNKVLEFEGSSVDKEIFSDISSIASEHKSILVILDSMHTSDHVAKELDMYSHLVSINSFICVMDTAIGYLPEEFSINRPWNPNNSPLQAAQEFLQINKKFICRRDIDDKLLISVAKSGYLQRIA